MKSTRWFTTGFLGMMLAVSACSNDTSRGTGEGGGDGSEGFSITGPISGDAVSDDAGVIVIWVVSSGDPDYFFNLGEGSVSGATFTVGFGSTPPRAAINSHGVGVGFVALLEPGTEVPDGEFDPDRFKTAVLAASPQHAIIWRDASRPGLSWSGSFPDGYGCGKCVAAPDGGFDSFEPVACTEVEVQATSDMDSLEFCGWT
ncbi:hypothetical protein [Sorangium sp. So ce1182]|uniref:hypothetical protein n=1 Tax=Sorangium sp. So ce1182 TaxID=3133334 RepID=UPI003F5DD591